MKAALLLDFDGLILDTETAIYEAWAVIYRQHGVEPIDRATWAASLGRNDDDPLDIDPRARLAELVGPDLDVDEVDRERRARRDELLAASPIRPGIEDWIDAARGRGIPVAVCSSSPTIWVESLLAERGLRDRVDHVSCAGDGVPGKPDPAVYLRACAAFGVDPARTVAADDTPIGTQAAKAAGAHCIAVSAGMTEGLEYPHADLVVPSLAAIDAGAVLGTR
ncbi:MAG: HAD family phosphatase [Actinomycetota bacterium]